MTRGILRYSLFKNPVNITYKSWRPYTFSYRNQLRLTQNAGKRPFVTSNGLWKEKLAEKAVAGIPYKNLTVGVPKEMWPKEKR